MSEPKPPRVFLSYSRPDRRRVAKLADALQVAGINVWWDTAIEGGASFSADIERELEAADVVIVGWSAASVKSTWVLDEAGAGRDRNRLVPVQLDATLPPLGFRQFQAIDLSAWKGRAGDAKFAALVSAIQKLAGSAAVVPVTRAAPASSGPSRRLLISSAAVLAALAAGGFGAWKFMGQKTDDRTSIAVLPFANLSGDAAQAYFSDGIAEELRSSLSSIAGLQVAARTSSELMRNADVKEAAQKLGVAHVLTGSVRRGDGTIRVTTQLLNGETGLETWSEAYDRPEGDALVVQTSIATNVANALSLSLGKAAAMLGGTKNPEAYDAYLRGMALTKRDEAGFRSRIAAFDAAIAIDPDFAAAHAYRSTALTNLYWEVGGVDVLAAAEKAAARSITLAPTLPYAEIAVGYQQQAALNFRGAAESNDKLLSMPNLQGQKLYGSAVFMANMGRSQEALVLAEKAVALDPLNSLAKANLAIVLIAARQGKAALTVIEAAVSANPEQKEVDFYDAKGRSLLLLNRPNDALAAFNQARDPRLRAWGQAIARARLGDRAGSDKALAMLKADYADIGAYQIASVHAVRGETDLAFAALEHAIVMKNRGLARLRTDFTLDSLRKDPRLAAIEKRLGFPPL